jgi:hypothetical protein
MKKRRCRKFDNEELYNLRSSPNVISVTQILRMRWCGCVAYAREIRNTRTYRALVRNNEGRSRVVRSGRN